MIELVRDTRGALPLRAVSLRPPLTPDNLAQAELCFRGVLHNSGKLYGSAFNRADRPDPAKPYSLFVYGGKHPDALPFLS